MGSGALVQGQPLVCFYGADCRSQYRLCVNESSASWFSNADPPSTDFLSFTVFLAFNSLEFSNNRWRALFGLAPQSYPLMTLPGYLRFGGLCFIVVTLYLFLFQKEEPSLPTTPTSATGGEDGTGEMHIRKVYRIMWQIVKLPHVQSFLLLHLVAKLGVATNDAATSLKLLEKGLSKEDLALAVLVDFPFQIVFGYFAAKWSKGDKPLRPVSSSSDTVVAQGGG